MMLPAAKPATASAADQLGADRVAARRRRRRRRRRGGPHSRALSIAASIASGVARGGVEVDADAVGGQVGAGPATPRQRAERRPRSRAMQAAQCMSGTRKSMWPRAVADLRGRRSGRPGRRRDEGGRRAAAAAHAPQHRAASISRRPRRRRSRCRAPKTSVAVPRRLDVDLPLAGRQRLGGAIAVAGRDAGRSVRSSPVVDGRPTAAVTSRPRSGAPSRSASRTASDAAVGASSSMPPAGLVLRPRLGQELVVVLAGDVAVLDDEAREGAGRRDRQHDVDGDDRAEERQHDRQHVPAGERMVVVDAKQVACACSVLRRVEVGRVARRSRPSQIARRRR